MREMKLASISKREQARPKVKDEVNGIAGQTIRRMDWLQMKSMYSGGRSSSTDESLSFRVCPSRRMCTWSVQPVFTDVVHFLRDNCRDRINELRPAVYSRTRMCSAKDDRSPVDGLSFPFHPFHQSLYLLFLLVGHVIH